MTNDIARLPKWAQQHIEGLKRDKDRLRAELARRDANEPSEVWVSAFLDRRTRYLDKGSQVTFRLDGVGDTGRLQSTLTVGVRDGHLHVMADGHPWGLAVKPQSGNVVNIAVVDQ